MHKIAIPESGRLECKVRIKPFDSYLLKDISFKIDTGADFSTISKSDLLDLGYTADWIEVNKELDPNSPSVASGEKITSYFIRLPFISIYGIKGVNYPFGILMDKEENLPKPSCKGCVFTEEKKLDYRLLLGNDILSCFKLAVDWKSGFFELERHGNLDFRNKLYPGRQLNLLEAEQL